LLCNLKTGLALEKTLILRIAKILEENDKSKSALT